MLTVADIKHVINMVISDNKGQVLTEALCIGIEQSIVHYCTRIQESAQLATEKCDG